MLKGKFYFISEKYILHVLLRVGNLNPWSQVIAATDGKFCPTSILFSRKEWAIPRAPEVEFFWNLIPNIPAHFLFHSLSIRNVFTHNLSNSLNFLSQFYILLAQHYTTKSNSLSNWKDSFLKMSILDSLCMIPNFIRIKMSYLTLFHNMFLRGRKKWLT